MRSKAQRMFLKDEGLRLKPYRCTAGRLTIGVGRNIDDVGITEETAFQMLDEDVNAAQAACLRIFGQELWGKWDENRKLGWINLAFNLGEAGLMAFKNTIAHAKAGRWKEVKRHLYASKWATQVKGRADRVVAMICEGEFPYA